MYFCREDQDDPEESSRCGASFFECRTIARLKSKEHFGTWAPDGIEFTSLEIL